MKRSIRLNEKLVEQAENARAKSKRSIASQLEYWAGIGQQVEQSTQPSSERINTLKEFNSSFIDLVQKSTSSGEFEKSLFGQHPHVFVKSKMGDGFVDKVFKDGTSITGRVVSGVFVELGKNKARKK